MDHFRGMCYRNFSFSVLICLQRFLSLLIHHLMLIFWEDFIEHRIYARLYGTSHSTDSMSVCPTVQFPPILKYLFFPKTRRWRGKQSLWRQFHFKCKFLKVSIFGPVQGLYFKYLFFSLSTGRYLEEKYKGIVACFSIIWHAADWTELHSWSCIHR